MDRFLKENWRGIRECVGCSVSPYTTTRDGKFVLDTVPGCPNVAVFAGGNGRAFKFAPLIGKCLADIVSEQEPSFDIGPLSAARGGIWLQLPTYACRL
eukprot:CAMPEP_0117648066 /NCGR_PEP_ID=MMETSP0804-20121206/190_1 /TAXON_ID=1074897 /ORGANISM="Tetraselmis astigmatica, Strain CCMP880" /LENGTH=97 /DNA_ID=CAMNT_0005453611 /DNA_START=158 /DNA_END=451 /DNA_ORIENTATION=+